MERLRNVVARIRCEQSMKINRQLQSFLSLITRNPHSHTVIASIRESPDNFLPFFFSTALARTPPTMVMSEIGRTHQMMESRLREVTRAVIINANG
ncbi:hypothetical protein DMENIID0001_146960 [Sergentomyia squamirostris]